MADSDLLTRIFPLRNARDCGTRKFIITIKSIRTLSGLVFLAVDFRALRLASMYEHRHFARRRKLLNNKSSFFSVGI